MRTTMPTRMTAVPFVVDIKRVGIPIAVAVVGIGALAWSILAGGTLALGVPITLFGAGCLGWSLLREKAQAWQLPALQLLAVVLLSMSLLGLCQSQCGAFEAYARVLGTSTLAVAFGLHVGLLIIGVVALQATMPKWVYVAALGLGQGASVFFIGLMAATQFWCASCAATHAVILLQAIVLWRLLRVKHERWMWMLWVLVVAGGVNLLFHHRVVPATQNQPQQLLQWLASKESGRPLGQIVIADATTEPPDTVVALADSAQAHLTSGDQTALLPVPQRPGARKSAASRTESPAVASARTAIPAPSGLQARTGLHGSSDAPIRLMANVDPLCHHCEVAVQSVIDLEEDVQAKRVQIGLALVVPTMGEQEHFGASVAASCIQAAAEQSGQHMLLTARALMTDAGRSCMAALDAAKQRERGALEHVARAATPALSGLESDPAAYQSGLRSLAAQDPAVQSAREAVRAELHRLNLMLPPEVDKQALNAALQAHRGDYVLQRAAVRDRMRQFGIPQAPTYWAYHAHDPTAQPYTIIRGAKEPLVLRYVITKGLEGLQ